ncbi:MAG: chemotaxis protein CheW [Gammaproteobacteria bacterium]|nr:chemotaxis protein CheW [Gammaproteobacteria bacterium]
MKKRPTKINKSDNCWSTVGVWGNAQEKCDRLDEVVHCRNCDVFLMAGRGVFESRPPSGYLSQWQKEISNKKEEREKGDVGVMVFRLGKEWLSLPVEYLQEIVEEKKIHKIPHNEGVYILGVVNIGGEVNTCYSLMNLLEIEENANKDDSELRRLIVLVVNGDRFVLPVCEISGLARYSSTDLLPAPATLGKKMGTYLAGMFLIKKRQVAALNVDQIYRGFEGIMV